MLLALLAKTVGLRTERTNSQKKKNLNHLTICVLLYITLFLDRRDKARRVLKYRRFNKNRGRDLNSRKMVGRPV